MGFVSEDALAAFLLKYLEGKSNFGSGDDKT